MSVLVIVRSKAFKRDMKRLVKRKKDLAKLRAVLVLLAEENLPPAVYRDHALQGDWKGFRDLHIEPDWLLIYRVHDRELQLARTGSHADLFRS
jgi:mRNA interferase YafQ